MNDRFEYDDNVGGSGARLLSTVGCFQRHNRTRDEQELTTKETKIRNFETFNREDRAEQRLQNKLVQYFNQGYKLRPDESAEAFIERVEADKAFVEVENG
jgi:hypothetical protein